MDRLQKLNKRQARQTLYLSRFNFMLKHVPENKIGKADSLSKRLDQKAEVEKDNKDETLIKPEWLEVRKTKKVEVIVEGVNLLEKVRQSKVKDNKVIKVIKEMKRVGVKMLRDKEWREIDGVIYKEKKVYVPKDNILRVEIIRLHHNMLAGEHKGQQKTVELVTRNFWQPGVIKEIKRYVEGYDSYQKNKNHTEQLAGKLISNSIPEKPWTHISADFTTKLPLAQGYDMILVVVN